MLTDAEALAQVSRFRRCANYPMDEDGISDLAAGLKKAAKGLEQARAIVARCLELSSYCPADHDLLTVAAELYPPPAPSSWTPRTYHCSAGRCDGDGWERVFVLHTQEGGGSCYTRKERITEAVAHELRGKLGPMQQIYEGVKRCPCKATTDVRQLAAGDTDA